MELFTARYGRIGNALLNDAICDWPAEALQLLPLARAQCQAQQHG